MNKPPESGQVAPVSLEDSPGSRRRRGLGGIGGLGSGVRPTTAAPIMIMPAFNHAKSVDENRNKEEEGGEEGKGFVVSCCWIYCYINKTSLRGQLR